MNTPSATPGKRLNREILAAALELHSRGVTQFDEDEIDSAIEKNNCGPIYSLRATLQAGLRYLIENGLMECRCTTAAGAEQQSGQLYELTERGLKKAEGIVCPVDKN